ncbi:MAG: GyrI-like domain-containing protein [Propionicimonas sp.]|uniref:GyrI-like domain-containing protein n=1 Tax=Propionicimonas sp. TaxID=1955623 RepID=UPI003D14B747
MAKIDFKRTLPCYQARAGRFDVLDIGPLRYLMIDGHGDPNAGGPFAEAVTALFSVGYPLKFASKNQLGRDYAVMPLEGLWSAADPSVFTTSLDKASWDWTLLMLVPDWIDEAMFASAVAGARTKAGLAVDRLRLETLDEGRCVQTLHVGPFDDEGEVLRRLHEEFLPTNRLRPTGRHHEIYLSDITRTAPDKLRTILRQPVAALA